MVNNEFVRMLGISIEIFKNTHKGEIKPSSMNTNKIESDINGICGQNGSGKTSIITAISIIKGKETYAYPKTQKSKVRIYPL